MKPAKTEGYNPYLQVTVQISGGRPTSVKLLTKNDDDEGTIADQLAARKAEKATGQYLGAEEVLESQWEEKFDVERQKKYWVHKETGETTFEEPKKSSLEMTSAERELEEAKRRNEERKAAKEASINFCNLSEDPFHAFFGEQSMSSQVRGDVQQ